METKQNPAENFALSEGGPFYDWLKKKRIYKSPLKLGFVGLCITWLPLAIITAVDGTFLSGSEMPFIKDFAMQARLLIAFPMLLMIQPFIDARVMVVSNYLSGSLIRPEEREEVLAHAFGKARRLTSSSLTEIILVLIIIATTASFVKGGVYSALTRGTSWMASTNSGTQSLSFAGYWATCFSIPVFQFFLYRWLWRYFVWVIMLFRLSKVNLKLMPTHADRAGGLGILALAQSSFNFIFMTGSVILSGQFIAELLLHPDSFTTIRGLAIGYIIISLVLIIFPLLFFMGKLIQTKNNGLIHLSNLGAGLSGKFEKDWVNDLPVEKIETADPVNPSMIYDYTGMYDYLHQLRPVPITVRDVISMAIMLFVPFIPILFIQYSVAELIQKIAGMLVK